MAQKTLFQVNLSEIENILSRENRDSFNGNPKFEERNKGLLYTQYGATDTSL